MDSSPPRPLEVLHQSISNISQANHTNFPVLQAEGGDKPRVAKFDPIVGRPA